MIATSDATPRHRREAIATAAPSDAPVVAVLGGISASRHVTSTADDPRRGWWEEFVGAGRTIDTNRFRVVSIDYRAIGESGRTATTYDQAAALTRAFDDAGIDRVRAVVGASYGGMVALAFGAIAPQRAERLVVVSAAHESAPIATARRILERRIVGLGIDTGYGHEALVLARGVAMTTYASAEEFSRQFRENGDEEARATCRRIDNFLTDGGQRFAATCTPERFLALSESLDLHRIAPEDVRVPATVIAVHQDSLVPIAQARELAGRLGAPCRLVELDSRHGHDTFLTAHELIAPFVAEALEPANQSVR